MISVYSEQSGVPVYCKPCFWSNDFNPLDFGVDFDFSRPFFEQFAELRQRVPHLGLFHINSENSDYTVNSSCNRDCYLSNSIHDCQQVHFSDMAYKSKDSMELFSCTELELCFQCRRSHQCFDSEYLDRCSQLSHSHLCYNCHGGTWLIGCAGVRSASNMILNVPKSKEECQECLERLKHDREYRKEFKEKFRCLRNYVPKPPTWKHRCEKSSGDELRHCIKLENGYNVSYGITSAYLYECGKSVDCSDCSRSDKAELLFECSVAHGLDRSAFCNLCFHSSNLLYCEHFTHGAMFCFGSIALGQHRYCALNKQYSKEEYVRLVSRIVNHMHETGEWGEFFPTSDSPFGYNETRAAEWWPLTEEEVSSRGWHWHGVDEEAVEPVLDMIESDALPHSTEDGAGMVVGKLIRCRETGKPYRISASELAFYRDKRLCLPRVSPRQRYVRRCSAFRPKPLWERACEACGDAISTIYAVDNPSLVYCRKCYREATSAGSFPLSRGIKASID
jgi:hypothetical protein